MEYEFDPAKDAINCKKHGVSLTLAECFDWDTACIWPDNRYDYEEERLVGWGMIGGRCIPYCLCGARRHNAGF